MRTAGLFDNLFQSKQKQLNHLSLRPGQMIQAKVTKLFQDNTAELQIGSTRLIAQLEAPMTANKLSWFQVQPGEGKTRLKLVGALSKGHQTVEETSARILKEFFLEPSKKNLEMVGFFLKAQLPVTKEHLVVVSNWLNEGEPSSKRLETVRLLFENGFPLSKSVLSALEAWQKNSSFTGLMDSIVSGLKGDSKTEVELAALLRNIIATQKDQVGREALAQLMKQWLHTEDPRAFPLLQRVGALPGSITEQEFFGLLIRDYASSTGQAVKGDSPLASSILQVLSTISADGEQKDLGKLVNLISSHYGANAKVSSNQLESIAAAIKQIQAGVNPEKALGDNKLMQSLKLLLSLQTNQSVNDTTILIPEVITKFSGGDFSMAEARLAELLKSATHLDDGRANPSAFTRQDIELLSKISAQAELNQKLNQGGTELTQHLKEIIVKLGLSHEKAVLQAFKGTSEFEIQEDTLKPLLLKFLNEGMHQPQALREAAENLVNKLTAFQLMSQEIGPIQQFAVQIPFPLWTRTSEVTLQFSGQKTAEGKINPDYCRVLFYLELEHLGDTIIDMQIQNRIIKIGIINDDHSIESTAQPLIGTLKGALTEMNYQLSAVTFSSAADQPKKQPRYNQSGNYSGLDIKI
ncbi:hypothetical protein [Mesobacillus harenae]|uniref:hypothetical protein n=1 Tax=Mesobacillus harenae TaxID=2213203 RepID=UPI001580AF01|nr:hypothetical protein [Mesobacillus harenae]